MIRTTGNHHTELTEVSFDIEALKKAPTDSARYAIAMKASEEETPLPPRVKKPSDLLPSQKMIFHQMTPAERRQALESRSNNIMKFLDKLEFKGLELE